MNNEKNYCTIRETSRVLGIADCRLREWQKQNLLPGFYAGTRYYVDISRLQCALDAGMIGARPETDAINDGA